jgi:hypothetical protein
MKTMTVAAPKTNRRPPKYGQALGAEIVIRGSTAIGAATAGFV